jgi:hypothetical protein
VIGGEVKMDWNIDNQWAIQEQHHPAEIHGSGQGFCHGS